MVKNKLYTKKVIEHFSNPHNYGKIKNPDGVGKVGNVICLLPNQYIHINNDLEEINKISKKDMVLSHKGKYTIINKIIERNYNGEILILKNQLGKISLTPDHLLLAIKIPQGDKFLRTKNRKKIASGWYHADQLKKRDIVLYPVFKREKGLEKIEINIPKSRWDFRSQKIPKEVPLSPDSLRLFGYFLSEGNIQDKPCSNFISFTLNIKEKEIVEDIKKISKKLFNLNVTIREFPIRKSVAVCLYSAQLARFFKKLFGNGAENKTIPNFIMDLPVVRQKPLIYGLWKGDGYINLKRDGPRGGYSTISYKLSQQIKILLLRQKIAPSFYREKERKINGVRHKKAYRIHVGQRDSLIKLCSILDTEYNPRSYASEKSWFDDSFLHMPITEIKKQKYRGKVYNLEVKNLHSFTSEAFCLHNCGDVMWLYIKVGRNEKGKEIIQDIKFETFGCVAALATSSIITDLAKGKTLEEALKIDKNEIVNSLGGLPPIKIHCSVLASDALAEAIYNYLIRNKKKIFPELKKRHERILKEIEVIDEKYKDWLDIEEKAHKHHHE